jgi:glucose/arabinose dehydrogenase
MRVDFLRASIVAIGAALLVPASASALSLQPVGNYSSPVHVTSDPDNANRLFVVEQEGRIQRTVGGTTTEFLDVTDIVLDGGERGLLSLAFPPDHGDSGLFYLFYTAENDPVTGADETGDLRVAEFDVDGSSIEDTRRDVLTINHSSASNHNGGQLQFGPDGFLYISTGDGGGAGDPDGNGQDKGTLLGKILRIDPTGPGPGDYTVPPGNPFAGPTLGAGEIWSYGLRNPWRFSFDRLTGALAIGDVGQGSWEEIDFEPASAGRGKGDNFGWNCREGMHLFSTAEPCDDPPPLTEPVFEYPHPPDTCASITGGYVVRDASLGDLYGRYLYADLCAGDIRSVCLGLPAASRDRSEGLSVVSPTSFGEDAAGRVYVASHDGPVYRLAGAAAPGACPKPAGSPGTDPPGTDPPDRSPPNLELDAKARQRVDRSLRVHAMVDEAAEVALRAKLRLGGGKALGLGEETSPLAARVEEKLKWKLSRRESRRARHRLRDGEKVKARVKGEATDASGNISEEDSLKIKLGR